MALIVEKTTLPGTSSGSAANSKPLGAPPPMYLHIFNTEKSGFEGQFPSPRQNPTEYKKHAHSFPGARKKSVMWRRGDARSYHEALFEPPKFYNVYTLHRASEVLDAPKPPGYWGELIQLPLSFCAFCTEETSLGLKGNKHIRFLKKEKVLNGLVLLHLQVEVETAFDFYIRFIEGSCQKYNFRSLMPLPAAKPGKPVGGGTTGGSGRKSPEILMTAGWAFFYYFFKAYQFYFDK